MSIPITALYVPGDRPDRFAAATTSGADIVIFDLEDAVAPANKASALEAVASFLAEPRSVRTQVRTNRGAVHEWERLAELPGVELRLPKVESGDEVVEAARGGAPVTALIESARGIMNLDEIANSGVVALALGESDLSSELGTSDRTVIDWLRVRLLVTSTAAGLPAPMLSAYPGVRDLDGLAADTIRGRDQGWLGRSAIHPQQLPVIRRAFRPEPERVSWAREVLMVLGSGGVATLASGEMVDEAMRRRAERLLAIEAATAE